jgi:hypothetical protein
MGYSTSHNPVGLHGLLRGSFLLSFMPFKKHCSQLSKDYKPYSEVVLYPVGISKHYAELHAPKNSPDVTSADVASRWPEHLAF